MLAVANGGGRLGTVTLAVAVAVAAAAATLLVFSRHLKAARARLAARSACHIFRFLWCSGTVVQ